MTWDVFSSLFAQYGAWGALLIVLVWAGHKGWFVWGWQHQELRADCDARVAAQRTVAEADLKRLRDDHAERCADYERRLASYRDEIESIRLGHERRVAEERAAAEKREKQLEGEVERWQSITFALVPELSGLAEALHASSRKGGP